MTQHRIYYEDTDAGGVVYYANYLRYMERDRTEFLRQRGLCVRELQDRGTLILVLRLEIDYLSPARLDDLIRVETTVLEVTGGTFTLGQKVIRVADGTLLVDGKVVLACLAPGKGARRLPGELRQALRQDGSPAGE
jgi:tol-pal system-associated acyl-CoA thioesterase